MYLMSTVSNYERLYIMTDVQQNHLAERPNDTAALFSAADVAIIPPGTDYKKRRNALSQSRNLLRQMTGCVSAVQTADGERFIHDRSAVRDGIHVCHGCIFHVGNTRGMIPLVCPDNTTAREKLAATNPPLEEYTDKELRQLKLP